MPLVCLLENEISIRRTGYTCTQTHHFKNLYMSSYSLKPYYESTPTKKSNIVFCRGGGRRAAISKNFLQLFPTKRNHAQPEREKKKFMAQKIATHPPPSPPSKNNDPSLSTSSFITEHKMAPSLCTTLFPSFCLTVEAADVRRQGPIVTGQRCHAMMKCISFDRSKHLLKTTPFSCLRYHLPR